MPARFTLRSCSSLTELAADDWNCLAGHDNPFVSYGFLSALEHSNCVGQRSGWQPLYLLCYDEQDQLVGATPSYVKSHSQGEYVFDQGWAQAYERAGGVYYPKLQISVPFTPATGPRLLTLADRQDVKQALAQGLQELCHQLDFSSAHVTFANPQDHAVLTQQGWLARHDEQFHWFNQGYASFDDFLNQLQSRKRKLIRKERASAVENGITIKRVTGSDLTETVWDIFYEFYMETASRKWGRPYLNRNFYSYLGAALKDQIVLMIAYRSERPIAGAINFIGSDTLYGRHWGALEHHPFLHFEVCYHQAIDYAIEHGLKKVEAGAQGEHKLARGYQPVTTKSAHYIADPALRKAVADYLQHERHDVAAYHAALEDHAPFRKINITPQPQHDIEE